MNKTKFLIQMYGNLILATVAHNQWIGAIFILIGILSFAGYIFAED